MFDPNRVPPVQSEELLARFILFSGWFRPSDNAVKQDAFIPHLNELSVTRHEQATAEEIWADGERVATLRKRTLYGRADVGLAALKEQSLAVEANPIIGNPNHAIAKNWPMEKSEQKMKALQIALKSQFVPMPK